MKRKFVRATAVGALAVALGLVLAACGGDGGSDGVASLTDTTGQTSTNGDQGSGGNGSGASAEERREAQLEFAKCMREHGVDMPDPVNGRFELRQRPGDQDKVAEAQEACGEILERVAPPELDEEQEAELREATLEFAKCMREHGVDMPDPKFEGGGVTMRMPPGSENDPKVEEAQKACQPILDRAQPDGPPAQGKDS